MELDTERYVRYLQNEDIVKCYTSHYLLIILLTARQSRNICVRIQFKGVMRDPVGVAWDTYFVVTLGVYLHAITVIIILMSI